MVKKSFIAALLIVFGVGQAYAQSRPAASKPAASTEAAFEVVKDDPKLPRVLILGDSISIGYTADVRNALKGKANVHRPIANCGPTSNGIAHIKEWLGDGTWDVIHFNFGLHDIRYLDNEGKSSTSDKGHLQVPPDQYEKNLEQLIGIMKKTGAVLIFATTTPVPRDLAHRLPEDAVKYNEVARRVMERRKVRINDLYAFSLPRLQEIQQPRNVHFTREGYAQLGQEVTRQIEAVLKK